MWQVVPVTREWWFLGEMQKRKMVVGGLAEVINIPAKHSCEQKAEQVLALRRFFSLLRNDEALVLCAILIVAANTLVDTNMNRFQVPGDKRLITLLNYSLVFSNTVRINDFSRRPDCEMCTMSELSLRRKQN